LRFQEIITAIQRLGFQVVRARRIEDAEMAVQTDAAIGCLVVDQSGLAFESLFSVTIANSSKRSASIYQNRDQPFDSARQQNPSEPTNGDSMEPARCSGLARSQASADNLAI
jgi:hypothetical protein